MQVEPAQNQLISLKLELRPTHGKTSGASLAFALQSFLDHPTCRIGLLARLVGLSARLAPDLSGGEVFGTPRGSDEMHLRNISRQHSFLGTLQDAIRDVFPAITDVVLPEGCVYGDGEGVTMDVAIRTEHRAMARSDFY